MNHVLSGEINAAGRATGYHAESAAEGSARIRPGTAVTQNANGTYTAQVDVFDAARGCGWRKPHSVGSRASLIPLGLRLELSMRWRRRLRKARPV